MGVVMLSDSDNDGVNDFDDQCPNTSAGTTVDKVGCSVVLANKSIFQYDFLVYPNPTNQKLHLELAHLNSDLYVEIFTINGKLVKQRKIDRQQLKDVVVIDVKSLPKNTYILHVKQESNRKTYTFIKR
jgi:hypothetical protein